MHHPMFGAHYSDNQGIIDHFLPMALANDYDVYFNGHEHLLNYAHVPKSGDLKDYVKEPKE